MHPSQPAPRLRIIRMTHVKAAAAFAGLTLWLGACAAAPASPSATDAQTSEQARITRSALREAAEAGLSYGRSHLGHFLDLGPKQLRREGLELPGSLRLRVRTTHSAFCVLTINEDLPSIHPWAKASLSSGDLRPSPADRCAL